MSRTARWEDVELRPARASEADRLAALMRAAIDAHAPGAYTEAEHKEWIARVDPERLRGWILDPEERFLVAEDPSGLLGFASRNKHLVRLLYVAPTAGGRGVGRALVEHLEQDAQREGHSRLELDASKNSVPFYTRLGYGKQAAVGCGGDHLLCTRMMKRLG